MLILKYQVGDPFAFMKIMVHWNRGHALPWVPLIRGFAKLTPLLPNRFEDALEILDALTAIAFLGIGAAMARERYPIAMWAMVLGGVFFPLTTDKLESMGRYVLALFPAFYFLGKKCEERPRLERFLLFASVFLMALLTLRFIRCGFAG
jgi:hypothetical protein